MKKTALVLEGGALRGVYTAGILDIFIKHNLIFDYVIGVSAGSLCGLNYVTGQQGRTARVNIGFNDDKRYLSYRNRIRNGAVFNINYLFEEPDGRWAPFDSQKYANYDKTYIVGATNCQTGQLDLFEKPSGDRLVSALKASCAMPLASNKVKIDNGLYLDGGVANSVPFDLPMAEGYEKIVVIKTQYHDYRKKAVSLSNKKIAKALYGRHPQFFEALISRPERYNAQMESLNNLSKKGQLFVIEPHQPVAVSHMEKDKIKLQSLYNDALLQATELIPALNEYLEK